MNQKGEAYLPSIHNHASEVIGQQPMQPSMDVHRAFLIRLFKKLFDRSTNLLQPRFFVVIQSLLREELRYADFSQMTPMCTVRRPRDVSEIREISKETRLGTV